MANCSARVRYCPAGQRLLCQWGLRFAGPAGMTPTRSNPWASSSEQSSASSTKVTHCRRCWGRQWALFKGQDLVLGDAPKLGACDGGSPECTHPASAAGAHAATHHCWDSPVHGAAAAPSPTRPPSPPRHARIHCSCSYIYINQGGVHAPTCMHADELEDINEGGHSSCSCS